MSLPLQIKLLFASLQNVTPDRQNKIQYYLGFMSFLCVKCGLGDTRGCCNRDLFLLLALYVSLEDTRPNSQSATSGNICRFAARPAHSW